MAITATQRNDLMNLVVGMFDAAPTAAILEGFVASIEAGATMSQMANDLAATAEFKSLYPIWLTSDEFATRFATNILDGNTDAAGLALAISEVKAMLANGMSYGDVALAASTFLANTPVTDPTFGQAAQALLNKSDVATYYATTKLTAAADLASLQAVLANVDSSADSVSNQKMLIDAALDSFAQNLTVGQDNLKGSAGNDAFTAWIFNNANTAQSGDMIDGGAGSDTLMAEIGNSQNFAISLKTNSVETAYFRVQAESTDSADNDIQDGAADGYDKGVQIDAQDMVGTTAFWSTDSRANLTIEDVRNNSHQTTLGWRNADAGDVNYEVYFDTQHITKPDGTTSGSQLFLEVLDLESMANGTGPLKNSPYNGLSFKVDGTTVTVSAPTAFQTTYADLVAGLNAALAANPATAGITASLGATFSKFNSDNGISYDGTTVVLTNSGAEVLATGGWTTPTGELPADNNVHTKQSTVAPTSTTALTQVDIIFDNIGRGSKSADFVAGNISQGTHSGSKGIQQFNIDVDRNSWVDEVRSTNNTLEVVNLENIGSNGSVRIDVLNDVRVVDANTMTGAVTLNADLTENVIAKYLNLKDTETNGASDNVTFTYTLGSGNDVLVLDIEEEAAAHEDFALLVSTGAGNDTVTTDLKDANSNAYLNANWLADQQTLGNLVISTGSGDDTVTTTGAGNFTISTGSGNDTVYTNNDGNTASTAAVSEVQTLTFAAAGETSDVEGVDPIVLNILGTTVTVTTIADNDTAAQVAAKVETAIGLAGITGVLSTDDSAADGTLKITFANTLGDIDAVSVTQSIATDATVDVFTPGASNGAAATPATIDQVNVQVTTVSVADNTAITFAGGFAGTTGLTLVDSDGSGLVETDEIAEQLATHTFTGWTVTDFDFSIGVVQFTSTTAAGAVAHADGDISGIAETYNNDGATTYTSTNGVSVTAATAGVNAGVAANADNDVLTFTAADFAGTFTVGVDSDGSGAIESGEYVQVALAADDSADQVATKVAAALTAVTNITATTGGLGSAVVTIDYDAALDGKALAEVVFRDGAVKAATTVAETTKGNVVSAAAPAQWVVGATNTAVADLKGTALTNSLLLGATVTVTFSGASIAGQSGVTDGDAVRFDKGFEKTVTLTTVDNLGNQRSINQAIKDAILNDDVLQEFLTVSDGPANTLVITSLVDGQFDEDDLQINLNAATVSSMTAADITSAKATLNDILNTSNATQTDGALQTALTDAVGAYATNNVLTKFAMGTDASGVQIQGNASVTDSDNIVNLGSGNDVAVLGTDANSTDVIVVAEAFGKYSVLNFSTTGTGYDVLNFGAYLNTETSVSGSAASSVLVAATLTSVGAATGDTVAANEVTIINDFTGTTAQTFAGLDATTLLAAINTSNTGTANYGNITENTLEAAGALANLVGSTRDHIVMIENEANDGEYKVFHLTSANNVTNGDFASATLLGTIDFGDELVNMSATNISIA